MDRVTKIGCPACGPNPPPSPEHGPGCEQCDGYGYVFQVPDSLHPHEVRLQIEAIKARMYGYVNGAG